MTAALRYFAYGSNLHLPRIRERVPSAVTLHVGRLPRYRLHFHKRGQDRSAKCNAFFTGEDSHCVYGVVYRMHARDKAALDAAEGLGNGYAQSDVLIETVERTVAAFCYTAQESHIDDRLAPYRWYKALVLAGAQGHGLPDRYIRSIERQPATRDRDKKRNALHMKLIDG